MIEQEDQGEKEDMKLESDAVLFSKITQSQDPDNSEEFSRLRVSDLGKMSLTNEMKIAYVTLLNNKLVKTGDKKLQLEAATTKNAEKKEQVPKDA